MDKLQVEQLEQRQLLNGTRFGPALPPLQPFAEGPFTARVAERSPVVDFGGDRAGPFSPDWLGEGAAVLRPFWSMDRSDLAVPDPGTQDLHAPPAQGLGAARPETPFPEATPVAATSLETASTDSGTNSPAPEAADSSHEENAATVEALLGTASRLPSLPLSSPRPENPVSAADFRADVPGSAGRSAVWPVPEGAGSASALDALLPPSPGLAATPAAAAPGEEPAEKAPVPPLPQGPGVLTGLGPFDLAAVERGMQQFLEQIERTGRQLAGHPDGIGLGPWLVAGAAAAMACEIARRQLRRAAAVPAGEGKRMPASPLDQLFAG